MVRSLSDTSTGESLSFGVRLPPPLLAMVDREVERLRAGAVEPEKVNRGTAIRALLAELGQRRAAAPTGASRPTLTRGALARILAAVEATGAELLAGLDDASASITPVAHHTAGAGQISVVTRTANDGAEGTHPTARIDRARRASSADNAPAAPADLAALKPRLVAAQVAGRSFTTMGREAGVDPACLSRWVSGARSGVSVTTARKLGEYLARLGF